MSRMSQLGHRLYTGEVSYDFVRRRRTWYIFSAILMVVAIGAVVLRGLTFGIEFEGGADFKAPTTVTAESVEQMRAALESSGVPELDDATINTIGDDQIRVQTRTLDAETEVPRVRTAIAEELGINSDQVAYSLIGASWGGQITQKAFLALGVFLVLVSLVIWAYFRNATMSGAALVALLHDLVLTIGIYALVGFTVTPATVIGVLTILGYSLYDTVVVFDKVRENVRDIRSSTTRTYSEAANLAVNQVLVRSINTTVIGVLPVTALLFAGAVILGEGPLKDLALALFVGMISGAYSSIFIATPLLAQLKERDPEMQKLASRVQSRRAKEAARSGADTAAAPAGRSAGDSAGADAPSAGEPTDAAVPTRVTVSTDRPGGTGPAIPRAVSSRPSSDGAAKRPQPQHKPRSQRHR